MDSYGHTGHVRTAACEVWQSIGSWSRAEYSQPAQTLKWGGRQTAWWPQKPNFLTRVIESKLRIFLFDKRHISQFCCLRRATEGGTKGGGEILSCCPLESPPLEEGWPVVVRLFVFGRRGPISKHIKVMERTKVCTWVLMGPENKIDCAGEG